MAGLGGGGVGIRAEYPYQAVSLGVEPLRRVVYTRTHHLLAPQ